MYQDQDRTTPYGGPAGGRVFLHQFRHSSGSGRLAIVALILGLLGIAVGAASLTYLLSFKSTTTAQISQMRQELARAQSSSGSGYSNLSGKLTATQAALNTLAGSVAPYDMTCAQALESQSGPETYWFPCSATKP